MCKILALFIIAVSPAHASDAQIISAIKATDRGQWTKARQTIAQTKDPVAAKLYSWLEFTKRKDINNFTALAQFIRRNPDWPLRSTLIRKAEEDMSASLGVSEVRAWFADFSPKTAPGVERYMDALLAGGQKQQAKAFLSSWWADNSMSREQQRELFRKYKHLLSRADHIKRFDAMLYRGADSNAMAIANVLGNGYQELARARIALSDEKKNVEPLIRAVPGKLQKDPGLLYERLKWRRKNDLDIGAVEILHQMPAAASIKNLDKWWRERHILIRRMLEDNRYKSAYLLAKGHKQTSGLAFAQAEWMAGWLALRFMDKPEEAYSRFSNLYRNVKSPISKARAAYWAGRAAKKTGNRAVANQSYEIAARFPTVFYGQLAAQEVGQTSQLPRGAAPMLSASEKNAYNRDPLVHAATLLNKAGMRTEARQFLTAFTNKTETPKAYRFAADKAVELGQLDAAVRISKKATRKGLFLTAQAYPLITNRLNGIQTEWALVHGIIRQESQFDFNARSPVGALGLMQLMPATAKETARKLGLSHSTSKLTSSPNHNIRLGSAYLDQMIRRFGGSYPMAIAAYNAGPGRVDRWRDTFGDPRSRSVDLIDWIELIPIYETRNYVQRVMEATQIYRIRLKSRQPKPTADLHIASTSS